MGKGIFLGNPSLNLDELDLSATSELGRRAGAVVPFAANSGLLTVTATGDAGDDLAHDIEILGTQDRPLYAPLDPDGNRYFTAPEIFATLGAAVAAGATAQMALGVAGDRLYLVIADGTALKVYVWTGTTWTLKVTATIVDASGGISCTSNGDNLYIAVANNIEQVIELWRFNRPGNSLGSVADVFVTTDGTADGIGIATNGSTYVLLVTRANGTGGAKDVDVYFGGPGSMDLRDESINDTFAALWTTGGDVRACAIRWNTTLGYVLAVRCGTSSPAALRLARSIDGDDWDEVRTLAGAVAQPTTATPWGDGSTCAVALGNRRIFVYRMTAAVQDDPATDVKLQWYNPGAGTWSAEVDADGGAGVDVAASLAAAQWRGAMIFAWRSSATTITVRRNNDLTLTDTGFVREIRPGEGNFVAGLDDDSATALYFYATGQIVVGDKFRIEAVEYDYKVENILDDFMSKRWRGADNAEQIIQLDAGSGRAFLLDAIAIDLCNLPSITVEIDDDVAFGSPSTTQEILATVQSPTVVSVDRNKVLFADSTFKEKKYAAGGPSRFWVKLSTGVLRILDNTHNTLIVDGSAAGATATPCTIFRDSMGYVFSATQTAGRYLRLITPTVALPDEYYEISRVIFSLRLSLPRNFSSGFTRDHAEIETSTGLKSGARFQTKLNGRQRVAFSLPWQVVQLEKHTRSIEGIYALGRGSTQLVAFWPFPGGAGGSELGNQPDVYMGRFIEPLGETHINKDFYSVGGLRFESEV